MKRISTLFFTFIFLANFLGCASRASNIGAAYVSPVQYNTYNCNQIGQELQRVHRKVIDVSDKQDEAAAKDAVVLTVGLAIFWPALFLMIGGDKKEELSRLKGEHEALQQAAIEKECYPSKEKEAISVNKQPDKNPPLKELVKTNRINLRSRPRSITERDLRTAILRNNFFDQKRNVYHNFKNVFVDNLNGTVTDHNTGLIWEKAGSYKKLERERADVYIKRLNRGNFAGRSDWRLPTIEELASLLSPQRNRLNGLFIDQIFNGPENARPKIYWTIDEKHPMGGYEYGGWVVNFSDGTINDTDWGLGNSHGTYVILDEIKEYLVRAVCAIRSSDEK